VCEQSDISKHEAKSVAPELCRVRETKKGGRSFHLLLSKKLHPLSPFLSYEPGTGVRRNAALPLWL
jgi:hypothetical protein